MGIVYYNILVAIVGLAMSPFITALIEKFSLEESVFSKDFMKYVRFDPKVSLMVPISFIGLLYYYGIGFTFVLYSFISVLLIISFFTDIKAQIIPNETNLIGFLVGIVIAYYHFTKNYSVGFDKILGLVAGAGIFLLIAVVSYLIYKKTGMGMGDVKLMGMLGLLFGFADIVQIFAFSFFIGAIVSILLLITKIKKSDDYIPFGPFIVIATYITMFLPAMTTVNWILDKWV